jgi:hypothetical protein
MLKEHMAKFWIFKARRVRVLEKSLFSNKSAKINNLGNFNDASM